MGKVDRGFFSFSPRGTGETPVFSFTGETPVLREAGGTGSVPAPSIYLIDVPARNARIPMSENNTLHLQQCLERLQRGDATGRAALLEGFSDRLMRLAHVMFRGYPRLRR